MSSFLRAVRASNRDRMTTTTNGMPARKETGSAVLDFFTKAGASRGRSLEREFFLALQENEDLAIRALLWTRDIREGAGERKQFRDLFQALDSSHPNLAQAILHKVPEMGRWDDLLYTVNPTTRNSAFFMIQRALQEGDALAAKWMPRKGHLAVQLRKYLGLSPKQYRKALVNRTRVVETQMSRGDWEGIDFNKVPSLASARYQRAFTRHSEAYRRWTEELKKPVHLRASDVKINAGAVYPYDVLKSVFSGRADVADEQWKALPNYVGNRKILPLVDVSGSMGSLNRIPSPKSVAVSLGIYLAEKNTSVFRDLFLTFSHRPKFELLRGSLSDKIYSMDRSAWDMNTDLESAFNSILTLAYEYQVLPEDMPECILILSDMQFDSAVRYPHRAVDMIRAKYERDGYTMPRVVFWNLNSHDNTPVRFDDRGVAMVSGFSPAIMKAVLKDELEDFTPYSVMMKTLMSDRYNYK